jgi:DNA-binding IclR family transcriptional regulator
LLQNGRLIAALGISVPAERMERNRAELTKVLLEVARAATANVESASGITAAAV